MLLIAAIMLASPDAAAGQEDVTDRDWDQVDRGTRIVRRDLTTTFPALAEGIDLSRTCRRARRDPPIRCAAYVAGAADQLILERAICPAATESFSSSSLVEIVRNYMRRQHEGPRRYGAYIVRAALSERFPCPS